MKQLMGALALVALATTGCANSKLLAGKSCGPACHVARSQSAPRPEIMRTAYNEPVTSPQYAHLTQYQAEPCGMEDYSTWNGCCNEGCHGFCNASCGCCETSCGCDTSCGCAEDCSCGCPDECCDCTCGCPEDCSCGCPEECTCGCPENCSCGCCDDGCCDASCGCPDGCCGCGSGCGDGCGPCQRLVGNIASGFCCPNRGYPENYNFMPGPPSGQVAYPYYTTRGPRDFLQNNPPNIGPY